MSKVYFHKELLSNVVLIGGAQVPWEALGDNQGVLALDTEQHKELIAGLSDAAGRHMGGISMVSEADYTQKKTAHPFNPSARRYQREVLRVVPEPPRVNLVQPANPAPNAPAAPSTPATPATAAPQGLAPETLVQRPLEHTAGTPLGSPIAQPPIPPGVFETAPIQQSNNPATLATKPPAGVELAAPAKEEPAQPNFKPNTGKASDKVAPIVADTKK